MSEERQMYDRFFAGSKYEEKWRKSKPSPAPAPGPVDGGEEFQSWLDRLSQERGADVPRAETVNPFGESIDRKSVA
jgi:hypothetical protein